MPGGPGSGPRPLPAALKQLRPRSHHRRNSSEPKAEPGAPVMPSWLPRLAKKEWRSLVPRLEAMGVLAKTDQECLAGFCVAYASLIQAVAEIEQRGLLVELEIRDKAGNVVGHRVRPNPAIAIQNESLKLLRQFGIALGLDPSSRARLHVEIPQPEDPLEDYLRRKSQHTIETA